MSETAITFKPGWIYVVKPRASDSIYEMENIGTIHGVGMWRGLPFHSSMSNIPRFLDNSLVEWAEPVIEMKSGTTQAAYHEALRKLL